MVKTPIGNGDKRYSPRSSETLVTEGTCNAGLVAVTVTPGRTAPLVSVTTPAMPAGFPPPWPAIAGAANRTRLTTTKQTINVVAAAWRRQRKNMCPPGVLLPSQSSLVGEERR